MIQRRLPVALKYLTFGLFVAALLFSLYLAVSLWFARCEGFACNGVGVGWLFYCAVYLASMVLGFIIFMTVEQPRLINIVVRFALVIQALLGSLLFAYWLYHYLRIGR